MVEFNQLLNDTMKCAQVKLKKVSISRISICGIINKIDIYCICEKKTKFTRC